jgi:hypothetical protein
MVSLGDMCQGGGRPQAAPTKHGRASLHYEGLFKGSTLAGAPTLDMNAWHAGILEAATVYEAREETSTRALDAQRAGHLSARPDIADAANPLFALAALSRPGCPPLEGPRIPSSDVMAACG